MKRAYYIVLFVLLSLHYRGQEKNNNTGEAEIFTITEEQAEFPGGTPAMMKFIQTNLKYPENARKCCIGGKTFLKFIVNVDGSISDCSVILSSGAKTLDEAAIEVIQTMPQWKAARMTGRPVRCYFNIPINFSLNSPYIVFNKENQNQYYMLAKEALEDHGNEDKALSYLQKAVGDPDAWLILGVINFNRRDITASKAYFQNAMASAPRGSKTHDLSEKFLTTYF